MDMIRSLLIAVSVGGLAVAAPAAAAPPVVVTDVTGQTVSVAANPTRIVLGEGRLLYAIALLERDKPFGRVAAWASDVIQFDPDAYRKYRARFPEVDKLAVLGNLYSSDFSVETVVGIDADLVIFPTTQMTRLKDAGTVDKLAKIGVATVFVDFRDDPIKNLRPSLEVMGKILGRKREAAEYLDFYDRQMRRVTDKVGALPADRRPLVFIENAAGYSPECCTTFGPYNYGSFVALAGGRNWGSAKLTGYSGKVNPETIFTTDFDVIVGTGANWSEAVPDTQAVLLGYEATPQAVQTRLQRLAARDGWRSLKAVQDKRFFSIYHQFYTSPYHVVAVQALAKLLHPAELADLDPQATFEELHARFLPIDYSGVFWAQLR